MIRKIKLGHKGEVHIFCKDEHGDLFAENVGDFFEVTTNKNDVTTYKQFPLRLIDYIEVEVVEDEEEDNIGTTNIKGYDC